MNRDSTRKDRKDSIKMDRRGRDTILPKTKQNENKQKTLQQGDI